MEYPPGFNRTRWFPRANKYRRAGDPGPLHQCLQQDGAPPVFAEDLGRNGAKRFYTCGYLAFARYMEAKLARGPLHAHEVLRPERASRVFVDIDCRLDGEDLAALRAFAASFKEHLARTLERRLVREGPVLVRTLDATTPRKFSQHLVADAFVRDVATARDLVREAVDTCEDPRAARVVDMQIYACNHSLRIPWASKPGNPEGALRVLDADGNACAFSRELLFSCLVQCKLLSDETHALRAAGPGAASSAPTAPPAARGPADAWAVPPEVLEHFVRACMGARAEVSSARRVELGANTLLQCVVRNGACPFRGAHRSNNQFLNVSLSRRGARAWFCCSDHECPAVRYQETDVAALICRRSL